MAPVNRWVPPEEKQSQSNRKSRFSNKGKTVNGPGKKEEIRYQKGSESLGQALDIKTSEVNYCRVGFISCAGCLCTMICNSLLFMIGCFCKMICNLVCFPTEVIALLPWGGRLLDGPGKVIFCVCDFRGCLELCFCGCFSQCTCIALTRHHLAKVHWERIWDYIEDQPSSGLKLVFSQGAKFLCWKIIPQKLHFSELAWCAGKLFLPPLALPEFLGWVL